MDLDTLPQQLSFACSLYPWTCVSNNSQHILNLIKTPSINVTNTTTATVPHRTESMTTEVPITTTTTEEIATTEETVTTRPPTTLSTTIASTTTEEPIIEEFTTTESFTVPPKVLPIRYPGQERTSREALKNLHKSINQAVSDNLDKNYRILRKILF